MTGRRFLLDTNILIDYFLGNPLVIQQLEAGSPIVPVIVLGELYTGVYLSAQQDKRQERLDQIQVLAEDFEVCTVDGETARFYGEVKSELRKSGTPIPENDIWIAALSRQHALPLFTNDRHFQYVKNLPILDPK